MSRNAAPWSLPLIAILLLKYLQLRARYGWSLSNLVALLCQQATQPGVFAHSSLGMNNRRRD
jgi:hypothetical protein